MKGTQGKTGSTDKRPGARKLVAFYHVELSANSDTVGFSRPSQPGKWTFISVLNLLSLSDKHRLQVMSAPTRCW
jgi:hypothetical protein